MWIHPETQTCFTLHSEIRSFFKNVSFPQSLDETQFPELGLFPVTPVPVPAYDAFVSQVTEATPVFQNGQWTQVWKITPLTPEVAETTKTKAIAGLTLRIDTDANQIYSDVMGTRATEYIEAENQAQAYKDAGYTGDAGEMVTAWATAMNQTAQWSADDILLKSAQWRQAQSVIRTQRLIHKQQAKAATTHSALTDVQSSWVAFVSAIRAELADALTP